MNDLLVEGNMGRIDEFDEMLKKRLGFRMRAYQRHVAEELLNADEGSRFTVVSMPTGSGKTILELFSAFLSLKQGKRTLVIEPTRFLCDQMHEKLWLRLFSAGKEYEGHCDSFSSHKVVISTPQTALKCTKKTGDTFDKVIIDEAHHAFGNDLYSELIGSLKPERVVGFTALLPRRKIQGIPPNFIEHLGFPLLLDYDFRDLSSIDPTFNPPKAIVDVFDSELNKREEEIYNVLYRGFIWGDPHTLVFLDRTFIKYGKGAFCESFQRAVNNGKVRGRFFLERISTLCSSNTPSHKARTLEEILKAYGFPANDALLPIITFTSRKASAYEFTETVEKDFPTVSAEVLTSDLSKLERQRLLERAKKGEVDFIASTLVGEEGVDIPEAGLMVMGDTPKSPLRFYQRIGRLIRISSPRDLKYMAVMATPKTIEYHDLEKAVDNLYLEGVDVGYILYNLDRKSSSMRLMEIIRELSSSTSSGRVPYTLIVRGGLPDPFEYYTRMLLQTMNDYPTGIWSLMTSYSTIEEATLRLLTDHLLRGMDGGAKGMMSRVEKKLSRGSVVVDVDRTIMAERAFYVYDTDRLSELLYLGLRGLRERCQNSGKCRERNFRIDRKGFLRLFSHLFPFEKLEQVLKETRAEIRKKITELKPLLESSMLSTSLQGWTSYNPRNYSLSPQLIIKLGRIEFTAQINYYNITKLRRDNYKQKVELIKANLLLTGLQAVERFIESEG